MSGVSTPDSAEGKLLFRSLVSAPTRSDRSRLTFASNCFKHLPNPFAETICNRAQTRMHHLMLMVIAVFMLMYLALGFVRLV